MNWSAFFARLRAAFAGDAEAAEILTAADRIPAGLSRRSFLRTALVGLTAAAVVDVDQLLWTPGEQTIVLPALEPHTCITADWIAREALRILHNQLSNIGAFHRHLADQSELFVSQRGQVGVPMAVLVREPQRFVVAAAAEAYTPQSIADDHLVVDLAHSAVEINATGLQQRSPSSVRRDLVRAMGALATHLAEQQSDVFTEFPELPRGPGVVDAANVSDGTLALRAVHVDSYDVYANQPLQFVRLDLLAGSRTQAREAAAARGAARSRRPRGSASRRPRGRRRSGGGSPIARA